LRNFLGVLVGLTEFCLNMVVHEIKLRQGIIDVMLIEQVARYKRQKKDQDQNQGRIVA